MPAKIDREHRRAELAEAVWRSIVKHGIEHTSMRNIADESGWSRGVLQLYFSDKDELMLYAFELACDRSEAIDARARAKGAQGLDLLRHLMDARLNPDEEVMLVSLVLSGFVIQGRTRPSLGDALRRRWASWTDFSKEMFRALDAKGALRPGLDPDREAIEYLAFVHGLLQLQLIDPSLFAADEASERMVNEYLCKVGSPAELARLGIEPLGPAERQGVT